MIARRLRSSFSASTLTTLRQMPACDALALLATYLKPDPTYRPVKDDRSARWHLSTGRVDFDDVAQRTFEQILLQRCSALEYLMTTQGAACAPDATGADGDIAGR